MNSYSSVSARLQPPCNCSAQAITARVSGIDCRLGSHIVLRGMAGIISAKAIQLTSWRTISNISNISNDLAHLLTEKGIDSAIQAKFGDLKITTLRLFALIAETRTELKALLQDVPFELNPNGAGVLPADRIKHRVIVAQITDAWLEAPARINELTKVDAERRAVGVPLAQPQAPPAPPTLPAPPSARFGAWGASGSSSDRPGPYGGAVPHLSRRQRKGYENQLTRARAPAKGKSSGPVMHEGLHTTVKIGDEWKPICFKYNSTNRQCKDKCGRVHCCQRCLDKHPVFKCSKAAPE